MARGNFADKLIGAVEDGSLEWATLARECVAYMSDDDCESVADVLGLNDEDDGEDDDDAVITYAARAIVFITFIAVVVAATYAVIYAAHALRAN